MKRNRESIKYDLSVDHRPLKKQKNDSEVDLPNSVFRTPPQILSSHIPQNILPLSISSTNNRLQRTSLPFRRSVLDERDHPRVLSFTEFNEERRKRNLKILTKEQYDFLQKFKSPEKWQLPQNELKEEILRILKTKESGVFMRALEVLEEIVKEQRVNNEFLEKSMKNQRRAVRHQLHQLSQRDFLDKKRRNKMKGGVYNEYSLKNFEGIQTYQIIPLLNVKNAIMYSLTFASEKLKSREINDDIHERMDEKKKEFRTEKFFNYSNVHHWIHSLILEGRSIEFVEKEGSRRGSRGGHINNKTKYYFLRERLDLEEIKFIKPEDFRRDCIIRVLRNSKKPMLQKEILQNSKNLSKFSDVCVLVTLRKMCEEGVLERERKRSRSAPFLYSLNRTNDEEEECEEEESVEEEILILSGKRKRKSILPPEKLIDVPRSNVIVSLDDAIVIVLQNSDLPLSSYEICEEIEERKKKNEFWVEDFSGDDINYSLTRLLRNGLIQKKGKPGTCNVKYSYNRNKINPPPPPAPLTQSFIVKRIIVPSFNTIRRIQSKNEIQFDIVESENGEKSILRTIHFNHSHVLMNSKIRLLEGIKTIQNVLLIRKVVSNESSLIFYHYYDGEPSTKIFKKQNSKIPEFLKEVCSSILDLLPFGILFFANLDDIFVKERKDEMKKTEIRILLNERNFKFTKRSDDTKDEEFVEHTRKFLNGIGKVEIEREKTSIKLLVGKLYSILNL